MLHLLRDCGSQYASGRLGVQRKAAAAAWIHEQFYNRYIQMLCCCRRTADVHWHAHLRLVRAGRKRATCDVLALQQDSKVHLTLQQALQLLRLLDLGPAAGLLFGLGARWWWWWALPTCCCCCKQ